LPKPCHYQDCDRSMLYPAQSPRDAPRRCARRREQERGRKEQAFPRSFWPSLTSRSGHRPESARGGKRLLRSVTVFPCTGLRQRGTPRDAPPFGHHRTLLELYVARGSALTPPGLVSEKAMRKWRPFPYRTSLVERFKNPTPQDAPRPGRLVEMRARV